MRLFLVLAGGFSVNCLTLLKNFASADGFGTMILVHRLDGQPLLLNALHIVSIERTPDTLLTLFGGGKVLVADSCEQVAGRIDEICRHLGSCARTDFTADKEI